MGGYKDETAHADGERLGMGGKKRRNLMDSRRWGEVDLVTDGDGDGLSEMGDAKDKTTHGDGERLSQ